MWSYYGSKANIAKKYPKPDHSLIVEPFAGTARYALEHFDRDVLLVDKYDVIVNIWKWLQQCSPKDILSLPRLQGGQSTDDFTFDCIEAKQLMGFIVKYGNATPCKSVSIARSNARPNSINFAIERIASDLHKIRHWNILLGSYDKIPNGPATWFIDPPYQVGGHKYRHSNKKLDYQKLSQYCKSREGQVIVCENAKANWLPFQPFNTQHTYNGVQNEVIFIK